jgi:two-component system, NarL family, captular synthesis response regulator RcsB
MTEGPAINVVIADDHPVVLAGINSILTFDSRIQANIVGTSESVDNLLDVLKNNWCDLLITDYNMPGSSFSDGLDLISFLRRNYPIMKIIVITTIQNIGVAQAMLKKGVNGLFDKRERLKDLADAVRTVTQGKTFISSELKTRLTNYQADQRGNRETLTHRELEVLRLSASGLSGKQIALHLNRSEKTISRQKRDAMQKLGLSHDTQIREAAERLGLV